MLCAAADPTGQMALNALLERCDEVLKRFVEDERLSGSCPLPRYAIQTESELECTVNPQTITGI